MQGRRLEHGAIVIQMIVVAQNYVMLIWSHLATCQRTCDSQQIAVTTPLCGVTFAGLPSAGDARFHFHNHTASWASRARREALTNECL